MLWLIEFGIGVPSVRMHSLGGLRYGLVAPAAHNSAHHQQLDKQVLYCSQNYLTSLHDECARIAILMCRRQ